MIPHRIQPRAGEYALIALFLALFSCAQAAYPPEADLSVDKVAEMAGVPVAEVNPEAAFDYVITVANHHPTQSARNAVVTDKLPYEVAFRSINVSSGLGKFTVNRSGDLIYVRFDEIPAGSTGQIIINVTAPKEAPTTLYNNANIRYGNDPHPGNNRASVSTYVPLPGYDQLGSAGGAAGGTGGVLPGEESPQSRPAPAASGCQSCQRG